MKVCKKDKNKSGIYCIINIINGKMYVGKSINIYRRICSHISDLNKNNEKYENNYIRHSWKKYGKNSFKYFILEYLHPTEHILKDRELFWIELLNTTDRNFGYNLRKDSSTKMITSKETSEKISKRLKKEWKSGLRNSHSKKLSENWKNNSKRKKEQSNLFSKTLTRYIYILYDLDNNFLKKCYYKELIELNLKNVISTFYEKKSNKVKFKNFIIERINC